jgi:hypothetical protein
VRPNRPLPQLNIHGVAPADLQRLTAAPRRYGWHATLKAPFALAPGTDWLTLHHAVQQVARSLTPFTMPPMQVQRIDDFLALVPMPSHQPTQPSTRQRPLASRNCSRSRHARLSMSWPSAAQQRSSAFTCRSRGRCRWSMTTQALVLDAAQQFFSDLPTLQFNQLALFAEPTPGADFVLLDHLELGS